MIRSVTALSIVGCLIGAAAQDHRAAGDFSVQMALAPAVTVEDLSDLHIVARQEFADADRDQSGTLSVGEFIGITGGAGPAGADRDVRRLTAFSAIAGPDGHISWREYTRLARENFSRSDKNRDRRLSASEQSEFERLRQVHAARL